jgi:hypothetical protein
LKFELLISKLACALFSSLDEKALRDIATYAKRRSFACVYRKLKLGHNGDAVRQGSRGNGYFQLVELGARKARPYLASDAFAIHYNRRHTRLESGAGALRPSMTKWSRHSRRIDPINLSAKQFCQGEPQAMGLSRMPIARTRRVTIVP